MTGVLCCEMFGSGWKSMNGLQSTARFPDLAVLAAGESLGAPVCSPAPFIQEALAARDDRAPNLRELTKAVCQGDEAAFTRFYDLYSLRIYKHLLVLAKGNEQEAREVLQTVVAKLARRFKVFDEERRLWGWLTSLARNSYIDLCRAQRRDRRFVSLEDHPSELAEPREGEHRLAASLRYALELLT